MIKGKAFVPEALKEPIAAIQDLDHRFQRANSKLVKAQTEFTEYDRRHPAKVFQKGDNLNKLKHVNDRNRRAREVAALKREAAVAQAEMEVRKEQIKEAVGNAPAVDAKEGSE